MMHISMDSRPTAKISIVYPKKMNKLKYNRQKNQM